MSLPSRVSPFVLAAALAACSAGQPPASPTPRPSAIAKRTATLAPTTSPVAASATPPGTAASPALATFPPVPTVPLRGKLRVDPAYLLGLGLATATPGGGLLSDQGVSIVRSGEVFVEDAAGAIISNNGSGALANGGGGLISDGGGGLVSKAKFGLLQAAGGELRPVARMGVRAVSMRTGAALGEAAFTEPDGSFVLAVPDTAEETLRIVARVPQTGPEDPRWGDPKLAYDALVRPADGDVALDEDSRVTTRYLRESMAGKIAFLVDEQRVDDIGSWDDPTYSAEMRTFVLGLRAEFAPAVKAAKIPPAALPALAARAADAVLARIDVRAVEVDPVNTVWRDAPAGTRALATLEAGFAELRAAAAVKLAEDPAWFDRQAWIQKANGGRPTPWKIERPTDFTDFFVETYLSRDGYAFGETPAVLQDLGVAPASEGEYTQLVHMAGAGKSLVLAFAITLSTRPEVKAELIRLIGEGAAQSAGTGGT